MLHFFLLSSKNWYFFISPSMTQHKRFRLKSFWLYDLTKPFKGAMYDTITSDKSVAKAIFAQSLKRIRREKKLSQSDLAELLAVSVETIKNWENKNKAAMPNHSVYYMQLATISGWRLEQIMKGSLHDDSPEFDRMPFKSRHWHPAIRSAYKDQVKILEDLDAKLKSGALPSTIFLSANQPKPNDPN